MAIEDQETARTQPRGPRRTGVALPGILLGLGLGGFVDGILLHQVLQWHHMRTGDGTLGERSMRTVGGLEANTLADGLFHAGTWALTLLGLLVLWDRLRAGGERWPWRALVGWIVAGWGLFNLVEGLVDHQLLGIHHVRDDLGGPLSWDLGFLASGVLLAALGLLIARGRPRHARG